MPGLSLRLFEGLSHLLVEWVESARIDLALVTGAPEKRGLTQTPMLEEFLYLVTADGSETGPIPLAEALAPPLAMPGENDALRRIVEDEARKLGLPLTVTYEIASIPAIKELALRGMANAILPHGAVRREVGAGELAARPIVEPTLTRTLSLVRLQTRAIGRRERQLAAVIENCLATLVQGEAGTQGYRLL